jgi:UDP-glucose 4-epimerase
MRYLITGGAGFIGSHLADALIARGDELTILDNVSTGRVANIEHLLDDETVRFHEGSILDENTIRKLVDGADVVVHLAASVGVKLIIERPLEALMNNIRGTEIVMDACADLGRKILITSTSEIYGKNAFGPLHEESDRILGSPFKSRWSYSTAKAVDEILAYTVHRERGTPTVVARLFNCVGPRQTGAFGMVLPRFVRAALEGAPLTVHGTGTQRRSFCHVADTVGGLLALLDDPAADGEVFNVGALNEISMNGLARLVVERVGSTSAIEHVAYEEVYEAGFEDMERRIPDLTKIQTVIGWRPTRSLDQILDDVIAFERSAAGSAPARV